MGLNLTKVVYRVNGNMDYQTIKYEIEENILTITLNRPEKLNAFNNDMLEELLDACDKADEDDEVKAIIFTGAGRAYCAGADLSQGGNTFNNDARDDRQDGVNPDGGGRLTLRLFELNKPVIAAINGAAVGVGVTMTLAMDIRIASPKAKFGFVFARRGIVPEACSSYFLPRAVGISKALEWCYSGKVFPAEEAFCSCLSFTNILISRTLNILCLTFVKSWCLVHYAERFLGKQVRVDRMDHLGFRYNIWVDLQLSINF